MIFSINAHGKTMKLLLLGTTLASLLFLPLCSSHPLKELETVIYHPPVVFAGYVNDDYDSLPGNLKWPNTCELLGDSLRMHFYSDTFHVKDQIWYGDHLILILLPNANDSIISTRNIFLHMARYLGTNYTYDVAPVDSIDPTDYDVEMRALSLSRSHGGQINIDKITTSVKPLEGNASLIIRDGRIFGTVP